MTAATPTSTPGACRRHWRNHAEPCIHRCVVQGTYNDYDVFKSPLSEFVHAVRAGCLDHGVTYSKLGETYTFRNRP